MRRQEMSGVIVEQDHDDDFWDTLYQQTLETG